MLRARAGGWSVGSLAPGALRRKPAVLLGRLIKLRGALGAARAERGSSPTLGVERWKGEDCEDPRETGEAPELSVLRMLN